MRARTRILVAEDDYLMRELVREHLTSAGYDVHTARTGNEALQRMHALKPHALVLDINLPDMDGFAVLDALRADDCKVSAPTLMLTARRAPEDVRRAVDLGAVDYLTKDALKAKLLPRLGRMLRQSGQEAAPDPT